MLNRARPARAHSENHGENQHGSRASNFRAAQWPNLVALGAKYQAEATTGRWPGRASWTLA